MKTLEVTDEQYALIQELREDIAREVVGKYGYVRERDVVQFLLDNLDDDFDLASDLSTADAHSTAVAYDESDDTADPSGQRADAVEPDEAGGESSVEKEPADDEAVDDVADAGEGEGEDAPADDEATDAVDETTDDEADADSTGGDASDASGSEDDGGAADEDGGAADDDDMLDAMMNLLETHDDKWGEAASADYRYSVELPDGSTERVQTKDDVRALLFKNYR